MNLWNPTNYSTGFAGRSDCPRWRGKSFILKPDEIIYGLDDKCVNYLLTNFSHYGLTSYPDRNLIREDSEFQALLSKLKKEAIKKLFKSAKETFNLYKEQHARAVDDRMKRPRPCEYTLRAKQIIDEYDGQAFLLDPHEVAQNALMKEIEEEDSDLEGDRLREAEFQAQNDRVDSDLATLGEEDLVVLTDKQKAKLLEDLDNELEQGVTTEVSDGGNPSSDENARQEFTS